MPDNINDLVDPSEAGRHLAGLVIGRGAAANTAGPRFWEERSFVCAYPPHLRVVQRVYSDGVIEYWGEVIIGLKHRGQPIQANVPFQIEADNPGAAIANAEASWGKVKAAKHAEITRQLAAQDQQLLVPGPAGLPRMPGMPPFLHR